MLKSYYIIFESIEVHQLLTVLYSQTVIADEKAISLIAKIDMAVCHPNPDAAASTPKPAVHSVKNGNSLTSASAQGYSSEKLDWSFEANRPNIEKTYYHCRSDRSHLNPKLSQNFSEKIFLSIPLTALSSSYTYRIEFEPFELDQIIRVLYVQTIIEDHDAIRLIAKINLVVHEDSSLRTTLKRQNLLVNQNLDLSIAGAEEIYRRYHRRYGDPVPLLLPADPLGTIDQSVGTIAATPISSAPATPALGFTMQQPKTVIYCELRSGSYWHFLNEQQEPIPIQAPALTCILQSLDIVHPPQTLEPKLHLHVQADKLYCLESSWESLFSTKLVSLLATLSPQQCRSPLIIEPVLLQHVQELTCRVYVQGMEVLPEVDHATSSWDDLIQQVQTKLQPTLGPICNLSSS